MEFYHIVLTFAHPISCKFGRRMLYVMFIMQGKFVPIFLFFAILFSLTLHAEETVYNDLPLKIEGEKVDYLLKDGLVIAIDKASVEYKDIKIFADRLEINTNTEDIKAINNVHYIKDENSIEAKHLLYNLKSQKGYFTDVIKGHFPPWYWKGKRIEILSENEFILIRGSFTTCNHEPPHYRLSCTSATLDMEDKATAKNVLFFIDGIPIFYFPFYYTYMKNPPYGLVNWVGHSDEKGWMDLAHYNWYVNDDFRGRIYLDYIEKLGWGQGFDFDIETPGGEYYIYGYYMNEDDDFYDGASIKRFGGTADSNEKYKRWKGVFKHRQEWQNDWTSIMRIERFSDENFNKDFYFEERNKGFSTFALTRDPENYLALERIKPNYNSIIYANNALNDFQYLIERKPSISFSTREQKIEGSPFFYKLDADYSHLNEVFPEDEDIDEDTELDRIDLLGKISSPHKITNWVTSEPYLTFRGTGYSKNEDDEQVFRTTESIGWNFRSKLAKNYGNVQHIFQPQIGYYYRPDPSITRDELIRLDPIDRITSQNGFFVELVNRLKVPLYEEAKEYLPSAEKFDDFYVKENEAQEDILSSTVIPYEKSYREALNFRVFSNYSMEDSEWENVFLENTFRPIPGLSLVSDATYTPDTNQFQIVNSTLGLSKWEKVGGSVGLTYYRGEEEDLYQGSGRIWFDLSPNMELQLSTTYDIENGFHRSNGVYLKKYLHCWTSEFQINSYRRAKDQDYTFEIFLTFSISDLSGLGLPLSRTITPNADEE